MYKAKAQLKNDQKQQHIKNSTKPKTVDGSKKASLKRCRDTFENVRSSISKKIESDQGYLTKEQVEAQSMLLKLRWLKNSWKMLNLLGRKSFEMESPVKGDEVKLVKDKIHF